MADKSFGVKELNLLNASGTPTVTSPNNLNLNANTVAISTSCTIGSNLDVDGTTNLDNVDIVGITTIRNASGTKLYEGSANGSKLFHAGTERLSTELYGIDINGTLGADQINCSGVSTITVPANANPHSSWDVVNNSASSYRFTGPGQDGAEDNPDIYLVRGQRYVFKMNASGHPFQIRVSNGGSAYSDGVTNNGSQTGNVVFNVQHDAPAHLFYQCTSHGSMVGNIYIVGQHLANGGNDRILTATSAYGMNAESNLQFDGTNLFMPNELRHLGDPDTKMGFDTDTIKFETAGSERLRITSTGLVGVNVTPTSHNGTTAFQIHDTYNSQGYPRLRLTNQSTGSTTADGFEITLDGSNLDAIVRQRENADIHFFTNNTEKLRITSGGKIGIGTDNPILGLDVMSDDGIFIKTTTHNVGAAISFSDAAREGYDQVGTIEYRHVNDGIITGTAEGFTIKGTESTMGVQIEGLLKVTAQPCATVYQCTGPAGGAADSADDNAEPLHFDHVDINQGGMIISQNNGRIQVPITGIYFVSYMVSGTVTSADDNDGIELLLLRNGTEYPATNSRAEPVFNFGMTSNESEYFCNNTLLCSLSKDDYLEVALDNIGSSNASVNRGNFSVMLMA